MRSVRPNAVRTEVPSTETGASCSLVIAQHPSDPGGWKIDLIAHFADDDPGPIDALVKSFVVSPPGAALPPVRVVAFACAPGALHFLAQVTAPPGATQPLQVAVIAGESSGLGVVNGLP